MNKITLEDIVTAIVDYSQLLNDKQAVIDQLEAQINALTIDNGILRKQYKSLKDELARNQKAN